MDLGSASILREMTSNLLGRLTKGYVSDLL